MFIKEKSKNDIKVEIIDSIYEIIESGFTPIEGNSFVFNVVDGENGYPVSRILYIDVKDIRRLEWKYNILLSVTSKNFSTIKKMIEGGKSKEVDVLIEDVEETIGESELISSYYASVNKVAKELSKLSSDEFMEMKKKYGILDIEFVPEVLGAKKVKKDKEEIESLEQIRIDEENESDEDDR